MSACSNRDHAALAMDDVRAVDLPEPDHECDPVDYGPDGHWARCLICGDGTFPVTAEAGLSCIAEEFWTYGSWSTAAVDLIKERLVTDDMAEVRRAVEKARAACVPRVERGQA